MAEFDLSQLASLPASAPQWYEAVARDFDTFLCDHASAEKKASGMAMNVAAHYPDKPRLLSAMVDLAVEELSHYREVMKLLITRGIQPRPDAKDPYVNALNQQIRKGAQTYLLDRLIVGAVVERRGAERFALIAAHIEDAQLAQFYRAIAASEERHWILFVDLAREYYPAKEVVVRFNELAAHEAQLLATLPHRASLH